MKKIFIIPIFIVFLLSLALTSYLLGSTFQYKNDLSEGRTAHEWEEIYNNFFQQKCSDNAVEKFTTGGGGMISLDQALLCEPGITAYKNYLSKHPMPMPKPTSVTASNDSVLPSWCSDVIQAWMSQGYSRATTNQLMKEDHPECTY